MRQESTRVYQSRPHQILPDRGTIAPRGSVPLLVELSEQGAALAVEHGSQANQLCHACFKPSSLAGKWKSQGGTQSALWNTVVVPGMACKTRRRSYLARCNTSYDRPHEPCVISLLSIRFPHCLARESTRGTMLPSTSAVRVRDTLTRCT